MVLKNITADSDDIAAMKQNRTLLLDDDADAFFLTKNINDTQIQSLLENINQSIHTVSQSPDFSSEEFNQGVSSGLALQFKLVGFNNAAATIENAMLKGLKKRTALLNRVYSLTDTTEFECEYTFNHNLPVDIANVVAMVNQLRGLVSDETLLAQIPFIDDVQAELDRISNSQPDYAALLSGLE